MGVKDGGRLDGDAESMGVESGESSGCGRLEMEVGVELMEMGEIMLNVANVGFSSVVKRKKKLAIYY